MGAQTYISQDITRVWSSTNPPMIGMWVDPAIDNTMVEALEDLEGVETVEGRQDYGIKWRLSPNDS